MRTLVPTIPTPCDCMRLSGVWEVIARRIERPDDKQAAREVSLFLNLAAAKLAVAKEADERDAAIKRALRNRL